jgi:hypothetical protein
LKSGIILSGAGDSERLLDVVKLGRLIEHNTAMMDFPEMMLDECHCRLRYLNQCCHDPTVKQRL